MQRAELFFVPSERAKRVQPEALAVLLREGGLKCNITKEEDEVADIQLEDQTILLLTLKAGYVNGIWVNTTSIDEQPNLLHVCERFEGLGWQLAEVGML